MAAIDLTEATAYPIIYSGTGAATWQAFTLPPDAGKVTVINDGSTDPVYAVGDKGGAPAGVETPTDGGAVGTHRITIPAGQGIEVTRRGINTPQATGSVYVAGNGIAYTIVIEPRP
jgi:hypothetical protein